MTEIIDLRELRLRRVQWVNATPERVYDLISDVGAMVAWSPELVWARYDEGHGPSVGSWFTGRNRDATHEWETRLRITEAEPGTAFAWVVHVAGVDATRWGYTLGSHDDGTLVEESWRVLRVLPPMGSTYEELLALRSQLASGMEATLAALAGSFVSSKTP